MLFLVIEIFYLKFVLTFVPINFATVTWIVVQTVVMVLFSYYSSKYGCEPSVTSDECLGLESWSVIEMMFSIFILIFLVPYKDKAM